MNPSLSSYFATVFPGKVRKIAVNAGLGCPNRDGSCGCGGCIFCNNEAFNPRYARDYAGSISDQIAAGIRFSEGKGEVWGYLPYFQSYSNTYGPTEKLVALYEEALAYPGVAGLVIATRPDCLAPDLLDWFEQRFGRKASAGHPYLLVEIGVESTNDATLKRINRGHDFACSASAVTALSERGIDVGVHMILGLPGEGEEDYEQHARRISALPVKTLKLHHLQVVKGTELARMYASDPGCVNLFTPEGYALAVKRFMSALRPDIVVDRLVAETPRDLIVAPAWGLKPEGFLKICQSLRI